MKISIRTLPSRLKGNYKHLYILSISYGTNGIMITVLMVSIIIKWGKSIKKN